MKIFAWTTARAEDASYQYRIKAPLVEIAYQRLADVTIGHALGPEHGADVLINHHLVHPTFVQNWSRYADSALLVVEHDDDYLHMRTDHPAFNVGMSRAEYDAVGRQAVIDSLKVADLVTVSVPHLAQVYREFTDSPIVVLPNTVDEVLFEVPARTRAPGEQLIVGWGGTPSHARDWEFCGPGVKYGLTKAAAQMVMMGADFRSLLGYRDAVHLPWTNEINEYYLAIHGWHVLIAPLTDEFWSRSKSPLKALEAAALGIPSVVGDATPYRDFVVDGETGFICSTHDQWMQAIRALGADEEMRQEMGRRARERARGFITSDWAPLWVSTYQEALDRKRAAVRSPARL